MPEWPVVWMASVRIDPDTEVFGRVTQSPHYATDTDDDPRVVVYAWVRHGDTDAMLCAPQEARTDEDGMRLAHRLMLSVAAAVRAAIGAVAPTVEVHVDRRWPGAEG